MATHLGWAGSALDNSCCANVIIIMVSFLLHTQKCPSLNNKLYDKDNLCPQAILSLTSLPHQVFPGFLRLPASLWEHHKMRPVFLILWGLLLFSLRCEAARADLRSIVGMQPGPSIIMRFQVLRAPGAPGHVKTAMLLCLRKVTLWTWRGGCWILSI